MTATDAQAPRAPNTTTDTALALGDVPDVTAPRETKGRYAYARYAAQNDHYVGFAQTWTKAVLFLLGRQWVKWDPAGRRYTTDTDVPAWQQQPVTNITYAVARTLAAKLSKTRPTLEVVPPSGDSDDREAAELGQAILVHLWRLLKTPQVLRRALMWYLCAGQVYLRVHWDPEAGGRAPLTVKVPHPTDDKAENVDCPCGPDGEPLTTPDGAPDLEGEAALHPRGEIALGIEDPLSVRFDPEATDAEDAREMYVAKLWTRARAARHFKVPPESLGTPDAGERQMYADLLSAAASGPSTGTSGSFGARNDGLGASQDGALGDRVLVIEYYHRPDPDADRPEGAHWITCGRTVVWPPLDDADYPTGEAPLPNGFWPPLIPVLSLPIPGQPQAMGILPQVVPLNERYNALDGKILEHEVTMAMGGKWIVHPADKSLVITSDPAQVMASKGYAEGKPPIQAELKPLPAEVYAERAVIWDSIRTITAMSEVELGKKPEGVSAGRAFLVLQEVTDSVLGPDLQAWENALEEVGRRQLVLAQRHYREQRSIEIRGERGQWEVRSFSGTDLVDGMNVRVQTSSSFPWSASAQQDVKLNILAAFPGLVTDAATGKVDQERLAQFLDVGGSGLQTFESDEDEDLVEVQSEHSMFCAYDPRRGEQQLPQVAFWQDHAKHYHAHCRFMKRDRARFNRMHPVAQQAFLTHMQQTLATIDGQAEILAGAQQPPAPPAGAPGAPGDPNAPTDGAPTDAPPVGGMGGGTGTMTANERPTLNAADLASADVGGEPAYAGA